MKLLLKSDNKTIEFLEGSETINVNDDFVQSITVVAEAPLTAREQLAVVYEDTVSEATTHDEDLIKSDEGYYGLIPQGIINAGGTWTFQIIRRRYRTDGKNTETASYKYELTVGEGVKNAEGQVVTTAELMSLYEVVEKQYIRKDGGTMQAPLVVENPRAIDKTIVASDGIHIGTDADEVHYGKGFIVDKYGEAETVYGLPEEGGTLATEDKARTLAKEEIAKCDFNGSANIEHGAGNGSIQQVADGVANGFDFTGKNPNATAVDATLTGTIPYGATGAYASSFGGKSSAQGKRSHAEGTTTIAKGNYSHAEGDNSVAIGNDSHAEGYTTTSAGTASHAEGYSSVAKGRVSHAEGQETTASGEISHAEGFKTTASGNISHAEGNNTNAKGLYSHAEGSWTNAEGDMSHAEGSNTLAKGTASHAGGNVSNAGGNNSFAHGDHVKVYYENQAVFGQYNEPKTDTIFEIGNGKSENERNNAFEVCKDGTVRVNGKNLDVNGGGTKLYKHTITGVYGKTISNTIEFEVTNLVIVAYSDKPATDNISLTSLDIKYGVNAYVPHYGKIVNILDTMLDEVTVYYHNRVIGGEVMEIILNTTNIVDTVIEL